MNKVLLHRFRLIGILILSLFLSGSAFGQFKGTKASFTSCENQRYGFDGFNVVQWRGQYRLAKNQDSIAYRVPNKSVLKGAHDSVNVVVTDRTIAFQELTFRINDSIIQPAYHYRTKDTVTILLPRAYSDYTLEILLNGGVENALDVHVYKEEIYTVHLVPLLQMRFNRDSLENYLNKVYGQAGVRIEVIKEPVFRLDADMDTLFASPTGDRKRYTDQMIEIRDAYFDKNSLKSGYYLFLGRGFTLPEVHGYMVRNKAVGFIDWDSKDVFRTIAHELGCGIGQLSEIGDEEDGPTVGSTRNLMDITGMRLTRVQWELIRSSGETVSYYDDFERVRTNNGIIAYYFWEENPDGTIKFKDGDPKTGIVRPYKKNTYSLNLNITNFLFIPIFEVYGYPICFLHLFSFLSLAVASFFFRRWIVRKVLWIQKRRIFRFATRTVNFGFFVILFVFLFWFINEGYYMFEVKGGKLENLQGLSLRDARIKIINNTNTRRNEEPSMGSEVLIKRGDSWILDRRKPVLYFEVSKQNGREVVRFSRHSHKLSLVTKGFRSKANSHYFVFTYRDARNVITHQRAFNHLGVDITDKLQIEDPAERILLFVNGYRPTSLGSTFEENFEDIRNNGLEYPNTDNLIFSFDRYGYWEWNDFDVLFRKRINPTATYYADGHHSVATSNHRSLIEFTQLSTSYPHRCKDKTHHTCKMTQKGLNWLGLGGKVPTYETLNLDPNLDGFQLRMNNGKIAGRNILQMLNEIPSKSSNDTLYIVAHSMGYAYTLGIVEKLRGKINFGGLYIIAAENAESGKSLKEAEWSEIWQYGDDFEAHKLDAPCLLDGIAPQTKAHGLSPKKRVYIPEKYYARMGFFDSHFIGHYTWIFNIPAEAPGHVEQR